MKNTIKTIALSVAFLSGTGVAYAQETDVEVDTGLQATLDSISQQVANGSALNLAVNTADVDASVDLEALADVTTDATEAISSLEGTIETTAIGAANTGSISIEQGSLSTVTLDTLNETLDSEYTDLTGLTDNVTSGEDVSEYEESADISDTLSTALDTSFSEEINETLSNYSVANIAYNAGAIDASVSAIAEGTEATINNSITTTAIGAVNSGSITVTVK
ncbi:hypothetical protein [Acinetobacter terrestris]|jgi:hypothetical protein|uniref:Uncharacterized protein n=1 Tax=Acinetobacter terrestris TaxID=2529843 RepID=A0AAW6UVB6_9GAMM|nr:hypothetical protein [Acinetobacter terrestris]MDK1684366.1 hypothetical protein [Acinetobacter terrestris]NNH37046.1 hypothetical protein [Acinetobacter terrestris]TCB58127.1 hypothetical protein E0H81_15750 [Acinetobacter terrestris]